MDRRVLEAVAELIVREDWSPAARAASAAARKRRAVGPRDRRLDYHRNPQIAMKQVIRDQKSGKLSHVQTKSLLLRLKRERPLGGQRIFARMAGV